MLRGAGCLSILLILLTAPVRSETITFEEDVPVPSAVLQQYCQLGVEFLGQQRIFDPGQLEVPVATSTPPHALTNLFEGDEFGFLEELQIRFTAGQTHVSVQVGLDRDYGSTVFGQAQMLAYSDPTPGVGLVTSATVQLGAGPAPITRTLEVFRTAADIRSVVIRFGQEPAAEAWETIDDLTFDVAGPPCGTEDVAPPIVGITIPQADGQSFHQTEVELGFFVSDDLRVAEVEVAFLDAADLELASFFRCGGGGLPCPTVRSFASRFATQLPAGAAKIRVTARDFFGRSAFRDRLLQLQLPGPDYNLWAAALEVTQATQSWLPQNGQSQSSGVPTFFYPDPESTSAAVPLVAGRTTVVRLVVDVEGTTNDVPADGVGGVLRCFVDPAYTQPCPGYSGVVFPESRPQRSAARIRVDPAEDLETRRRDATKTLNFVMPRSWVDRAPTPPGGNRFLLYLEAAASAPPSMPECAGCDDGANRIRIHGVPFYRVPDFSGGLVHQVRVMRFRSDPPFTSYTPSFQEVFGYVDYLRRTFPVDESTISPFLPVVMADQDDEDGEVYCDNLATRVTFPYNSHARCCADGFRIAASYMGGDLDGDGTRDCPGLGLGSGDGYAKVLLPGSPTPSTFYVMAQEVGHANGERVGVQRGLLPHAGPPPGHGNECFGDCADDCSDASIQDCNCNTIDDSIDLTNGTSLDDNADDVPDECQCRQDSDCASGECLVRCEDWPWAHGIIGEFGFDIVDFEVVPGDRLECRTAGVCDNGLDDDGDGQTDEDCLGPGSAPPYDPVNDPHDFMSYGGCKHWVSPRTWVRLREPVQQAHLGAAAERVHAAGAALSRRSARGSGTRARNRRGAVAPVAANTVGAWRLRFTAGFGRRRAATARRSVDRAAGLRGRCLRGESVRRRGCRALPDRIARWGRPGPRGAQFRPARDQRKHRRAAGAAVQ